MFELYNKADADNSTRTKLSCDLYDEGNNRIVEFVQFEYSDFNRWGKPKVLTDLVFSRFYLPEMYTHITSKTRLKNYIIESMDEEFNIIEKIADMTDKQDHISISLPTSIYPHRRGVPTSFRRIKDTQYPLIVMMNGKDVSRAFIDFEDFEDRAVKTAYEALINGKMPEVKNDIFYIDGVKELHEQIDSGDFIK